MAESTTFPIELEGRVLHCRTEQDRTMLIEARSLCSDNRISQRHSAARLHDISSVCQEYELSKMAAAVASLADHTC